MTLIVVMAPRSVQPTRSDIINSRGTTVPLFTGKVAEWLIASVLKTDVLVAPWVQIPPFPLESNSTPPSFVFSIMKMNQLESILCDIDGLIGAALEAGDNENARALVEEFGEWFLDYDADEDIEVTCLEVLSEQ